MRNHGYIDKLFSIIAILVLSVLVIAMNGIQVRAGEENDELIDYNQYVSEFVYAGCLDHAVVFGDNGQLQFIQTDGEELHLVPCLRPDCDHAEGQCAVSVPAYQKYSVSDNWIYYIDGDEQTNPYALYRMSQEGEEIEIVLVLNDLFPGAGDENRVTQYKVSQNKAFFVIAYSDQEKLSEQRQNLPKQIVMVDLLEDDPNPVVIFDVLHEKNGTSIQLLSVFGDKVFASVSDDEPTLHLWMYDLKTQEKTVISEEWAGATQFILAEDRIYCTLRPEESFSIDLKDGSQLGYRHYEKYEIGASGYDDKYLYLTNTLPLVDDWEPMDPALRGLYIYDYEGNLIQFVSTMKDDIFPAFLLATEKYIFFYEVRENNLEMMQMPRYYIRKADIGTSDLKFFELDHPKGMYSAVPSYEAVEIDHGFTGEFWTPSLLFLDAIYVPAYSVEALPKAESLTLYGELIHTFEKIPANELEYSAPYVVKGQVYYYPDDLSHVYVVIDPENQAENDSPTVLRLNRTEE